MTILVWHVRTCEEDVAHRPDTPTGGPAGVRRDDRYRDRSAGAGGSRPPRRVRPAAGTPRIRAPGAGRPQTARERVAPAPDRVMVLVDTSVWIRFLSNREPHAVT